MRGVQLKRFAFLHHFHPSFKTKKKSSSFCFILNFENFQLLYFYFFYFFFSFLKIDWWFLKVKLLSILNLLCTRTEILLDLWHNPIYVYIQGSKSLVRDRDRFDFSSFPQEWLIVQWILSLSFFFSLSLSLSISLSLSRDQLIYLT